MGVGYRAETLGEDIVHLIRDRFLARAADIDEARQNLCSGTKTTAISAAVEELGKFVESAFFDPLVQIGTVISVIGYISSTLPGLGLIALLMIVPQIIIVLLSQRKVNFSMSNVCISYETPRID